MALWWSASSNSTLDEYIDRATNSSLEDMALNLEISDIIRSKTVAPREAMRSLKKRIDSKNPNQQLSALSLADTCFKNGGDHFLREVSSREFMDDLESLLAADGPAALKNEVRSRLLELIQAWAVATEGRPDLVYISTVYSRLVQAGYAFPPRQSIAASMIDSSAPPEWIDSDVCMRCRTAFSFTNRKHHCRNCGNCFDQQCSSKTLPLPHLGIHQAVRVDDGCFRKLTDKAAEPTYPHKTQRTSMKPRSARPEDEFDEDLKKALAMSLGETTGHSGYVPGKPVSAPKQPQIIRQEPQRQESAPVGDDDDDDFKKAIAASLADMGYASTQEPSKPSGVSAPSQPAPSTASPAPAPPKDHDLSTVEGENIKLFSTLVDRLSSQPPGTILREPQIHELYESVSALRPKLARTYAETTRKLEALLDLHAKLGSSVRYYDRMLEDRLSKAYAGHDLGDYGGYQRQHYSRPPYSELAHNTSPRQSTQFSQAPVPQQIQPQHSSNQPSQPGLPSQPYSPVPSQAPGMTSPQPHYSHSSIPSYPQAVSPSQPPHTPGYAPGYGPPQPMASHQALPSSPPGPSAPPPSGDLIDLSTTATAPSASMYDLM